MSPAAWQDLLTQHGSLEGSEVSLLKHVDLSPRQTDMTEEIRYWNEKFCITTAPRVYLPSMSTLRSTAEQLLLDRYTKGVLLPKDCFVVSRQNADTLPK